MLWVPNPATNTQITVGEISSSLGQRLVKYIKGPRMRTLPVSIMSDNVIIPLPFATANWHSLVTGIVC